MKELIIFTILGLSSLLTAIGGPINSDPAPGRSPGPPTSQNNNEVFIEDKEEILHRLDANILKSNKNAMLMKLSSEENVKTSSIPSSSMPSLLLLSSSESAALKTREKSEDIISNEKINSSSSASAALTSSSSSSSLLLSKTSSSKQCLDNFLNGYDKIVKTKISDENLIHLYVEHDIFTMEKGLLPNFVYLGEWIVFVMYFLNFMNMYAEYDKICLSAFIRLYYAY